MAFYGGSLAQLADQYAGDPRRSRAVVRRYRGTPLQILVKANDASRLGFRYEVRELEQGGHHELTIYAGSLDENATSADKNQPLADLWSLRANEVEKSLWDTPKVFAQLSPLPPEIVTGFRISIERTLSGEAPWAGLAIPAGVDASVIYALMAAISRGVESKPISCPVVARKTVIPPDSNLRPNFIGVDKVIAAPLLAQGNDPSTGGPIPDTILFGLRDGVYLKKMPTVDQTGPTTWEINQEWWWLGETFEPFVYDVYGV